MGTAEQVAGACLEYYKSGVGGFLLRGFDPLNDVDDYGRELIPVPRMTCTCYPVGGAPGRLSKPSFVSRPSLIRVSPGYAPEHPARGPFLSGTGGYYGTLPGLRDCRLSNFRHLAPHNHMALLNLGRVRPAR